MKLSVALSATDDRVSLRVSISTVILVVEHLNETLVVSRSLSLPRPPVPSVLAIAIPLDSPSSRGAASRRDGCSGIAAARGFSRGSADEKEKKRGDIREVGRRSGTEAQETVRRR